MAAKAILIVCAQALLSQVAFSQCLGRTAPALAAPAFGACGAPARAAPALAAPATGACGAPALASAGYGYGSLGYGYAAPSVIEAIATSSGGLPISSASAIAPSGLSVTSENVYEGALSVVGELPFLSAVALEGVLPSAGAGVVNHSCGNGITAITNYGLNSAAATAPVALAPAAALAPAIGGYAPAAVGIGAGIGCGCGGLGYSNGRLY